MRRNVWLLISATSTALTLAGIADMATRAAAGDDCCAQCGCQAPCQKVCHWVYEEKKLEVVCWGMKCKDFCVPGCSQRGCRHNDVVCDFCDEPCGKDAVASAPKRFPWYDWLPGSAKVYTKTKLMKRSITKKIPGYKWKVEDLCSQCEAKDKTAQAPPTVNTAAPPSESIPPPPKSSRRSLVAER